MRIQFGLILLLAIGCQGPDRELNVSEKSFTYFFDGNGLPKKVFYQEENGLALVEGDIILGTLEEVRDRNEQVELGSSAIVRRFNNNFWPQAEVPYILDSSIGDESRFEEAIRHFEANTSLRFFERTRETDYVVFREVADGCSANVGRSGGKQYINVSSQCSLGNVIHEIGHAVGLWHEQSRSDRDEHIVILWENISPNERFNFDQHLTDGRDSGEYDYDSVMHYGAYAFSSNGRPTITKRDGSTSGLGNRRGLSQKDIAAIQSIYSTRVANR